jgi:hypothetical protein
MRRSKMIQKAQKGDIVFTSLRGGEKLESMLEIRQGSNGLIQINLSELDEFVEKLLMWRLDVDLEGMKKLAADISVEEFTRNLEFFSQYESEEDEEPQEITIINDTEEES